ncbi:FliH/SctL family protein [Paenibacillus abyssi]|uniref:Flagellar assembly protein FliH/Type III secretion system HrpE domain-containing protein n=1 Tax=Paenibacillus abyssi TaxID=1340531 RepID=A0A917D586_9BACL|nr:FliH/SctL family protein [Paenibacillus abyssi]GGG12411.1 hypothetical protein GCM10010916_31610 [Paenibacillus abyssi]
MSNLFKSSHVIAIEDLKHLQWENRYVPAPVIENEIVVEQEPPGPDDETISMRDQILQDAEAFAEERIKQAAEQSEIMLNDARAQIDAWWLQKRAEDEKTVEAVRQSAYEQGYQEGFRHAEAENSRKWEDTISESSQLLQQAYLMKEQIIQEAEPFLVELSCAIAEKVLGKQLTISPDMALELIRKCLSRKREQGVITLCVAPKYLSFVQAAREELALAIDSQAELQILPDATVKDHGCVIRSAFGSIDARIDTQLEEIKRELIQLALQSEERRLSDEHAQA